MSRHFTRVTKRRKVLFTFWSIIASLDHFYFFAIKSCDKCRSPETLKASKVKLISRSWSLALDIPRAIPSLALFCCLPRALDSFRKLLRPRFHGFLSDRRDRVANRGFVHPTKWLVLHFSCFYLPLWRKSRSYRQNSPTYVFTRPCQFKRCNSCY